VQRPVQADRELSAFRQGKVFLTSLKRILYCMKHLVGMWLQSTMLEPVLFVDHSSMGLMMNDLTFYRTRMLSLYAGSSSMCVECCCAVIGQCFREHKCSLHVECLRCTYFEKHAAFLGDAWTPRCFEYIFAELMRAADLASLYHCTSAPSSAGPSTPRAYRAHASEILFACSRLRNRCVAFLSI
jgi:hypothetical protein